MKSRDISIDILKFFAALAITNSHMEILYHPYEVLATGGAIGDVLFFFASGYTLFLGRMGRFDNWYKRRINRIYPTVFAWAIMATLVFNQYHNIIHVLLYGGGWFVSCIMLYYVVLYFVQRFILNRLKLVFILAAMVSIVWYLIIDRPHGFNMYGNTYFKWCHYFMFMLLGAALGKNHHVIKFNIKTDAVFFFLCLILFYGFQFLEKKYAVLEEIQIITLIPLLALTYYFYKICNGDILKRLHNNKYSGAIIKTVGGLCLEIYLVQYELFTSKMNHLFPLNIFIMFIIIVVAAYFLRCVSRIFSQTFKEQDYRWKSVFALY